jgi:hypothetical protein
MEHRATRLAHALLVAGVLQTAAAVAQPAARSVRPASASPQRVVVLEMLTRPT